MNVLVNCIRGFLMSLADSVPGVSGGTIAYILGFYDKLINSLNGLLYGKKENKVKSLKYLINLGIGWAVGMILAILFITSLINSNIYAVSSLFLGFVFASIPLIIITEKNIMRGNYKNILFTILGIIIVCLITYFNPVGNSEVIGFNNPGIGMYFYVFFVGAIAITAMILPGISGSTLLLIFGIYAPIINSVKEIMHFNFGNLGIVVLFILGIITGILGIVKFLKKAIDKYRCQTTYFIVGLMIASLYAIVMGPTSINANNQILNLNNFSWLFFIIGILFIILLENSKKLFKK